MKLDRMRIKREAANGTLLLYVHGVQFKNTFLNIHICIIIMSFTCHHILLSMRKTPTF